MATVRGYRLVLKAWLGNACRFEPTCSAYALEALGRHGACWGSVLTGGRLLRCHPWCAGGFDPVPHAKPRIGGVFGRPGLFQAPEQPPTPPDSAAPPSSSRLPR